MGIYERLAEYSFEQLKIEKSTELFLYVWNLMGTDVLEDDRGMHNERRCALVTRLGDVLMKVDESLALLAYQVYTSLLLSH